MPVYSYAEASLKLDQLLHEAKSKREVIIQRPDGDVFVLRLVSENAKEKKALSKLGINLSRQEIVDYIREVRER